MDAHALGVLDFQALVERVVGATSTERGGELAAALEPSTDPAVVIARQELTAEAVVLLDAGTEPSLVGIADVRASAQLRRHAAARCGRPTCARLRGRSPCALEARETPRPTRRNPRHRRSRARGATTADRQGGRGGRLRPARRRLARRFGACAASCGAAASGSQRRSRRSRARAREHLQEQFVTERDGRPVLAVKAKRAECVPGIVHDSSGSGQTLFVEPLAVVELNNRLAEAAGAEREEVERILRELSAARGRARGRAGRRSSRRRPRSTSRSRAARSHGAGAARPSRSATTCGCSGARHPLLDPATAVPIDLDLDRLRALVVSGPNTGGKTVALKTLGLAALLHQSGLRQR